MNALNKIPLIISTILLLFCLTCEKPEREAKVETGQVTDIMATSVKVSGEIIDIGEGITEHGHCWGFGSDPTTGDFKTSLGPVEKPSSYNSDLQNLEIGQKYNVRAYAVTKSKVIYGSNQQFTTGDGIPQLTTSEVTSIQVTSAISGGKVTSNGGATITDRGVCWNLTGSPTIQDENASDDSTGTGNFTIQITSLQANTTYYVRAYATTEYGTGYGSEITFLTKGLPELGTREISEITAVTAICGGDVINDWGFQVTSCGVCWNAVGSPTIEDNKTNDYYNSVSFSSNLTNLQANTTYFVRAYAINEHGISYGDEKSFQTLSGIVILYTNEVTEINSTSAVSGGNIEYDGGAVITNRGVCWNTNGSPTILNNKTIDGNGIGSYTSYLTELNTETQYYVRAYAENSTGTYYGNELIFETPFECGETISDYSGNKYNTILIGNQCWMKENLRVTQYADGTNLPLVEGTSDWDNFGTTNKAYCYYNNNASNGQVYGALYTWPAAMNEATSSSANPSGVQGICPDGWHLPSDNEWIELADYLGGGSIAGGKMKESGYAHWSNPNSGATNSSGFTALPAGYRTGYGEFSRLGTYTYFWSSTKAEGSSAESCWLGYDYTDFFLPSGGSPVMGLSVRCLRD